MNLKIRSVLCVFLALVLLLMCAACSSGSTQQENPASSAQPSSPQQESPASSAQPEPVESQPPLYTHGYSLKAVGEIQDPEGTLTVDTGGLFLNEGGGRYIMLNCLGEHTNDIVLTENYYSKCIDSEAGLFVVNTTGDVYSAGLISADGQILIPCEAAIIQWLNDDYGTRRYLEVVYALEETSNENNCYLYSTSSIISSVSPGENDTMYTGYSLVYDLEENRFVDGVKITSPGSRIYAFGDSFLVDGQDYTLYSASGDILFQSTNYIYFSDGILKTSSYNNYCAYDDTGAITYSSKNSFNIINGNGGYIQQNGEVLDRYGNFVFDAGDNSALSERNSIFVVRNDDDGLMRGDEAIVPAIYSGIYAINDDFYYGTYYTTLGAYRYALIGPDGVIIDDLESSKGLSDLCIQDQGRLYVLNDRDFTLAPNGSYLLPLELGLIAVKSEETDLYGVFDLFTGAQLLDYEYEEIVTVAGYLYAYQPNEWTIFQISTPVN